MITTSKFIELIQKKLPKLSPTLTKNLKDVSPTTDDFRVINARLDDQLFEKVKDHVRILKALKGRSYSKETWLIDAIERKLAKGLDIKKLPTTRFRVISFKPDPKLLEQVDRQVALLKSLRGTYSRNQWILDAINEKIDAEAKSIEGFVKAPLKSKSLLKKM